MVNKKEAIEAIAGGANIIDVKNPKEGSLGANYPRVIAGIRSIVPLGVEISATIGDLPYLPGTSSLAALGAAILGVDYVKAGVYGPKAPKQALRLLKEVCRAVKEYDDSIKVVATGYADFERRGSIDPLLLPEIASKVGLDGVMIDVKNKKAGRIFDFLSDDQLFKFVHEARKYGLIVALAGSIEMEDLPGIKKLGVDVVGVRKAVCTGKDRWKGRIDRDLVLEFSKAMRS